MNPVENKNFCLTPFKQVTFNISITFKNVFLHFQCYSKEIIDGEFASNKLWQNLAGWFYFNKTYWPRNIVDFLGICLQWFKLILKNILRFLEFNTFWRKNKWAISFWKFIYKIKESFFSFWNFFWYKFSIIILIIINCYKFYRNFKK